VVRITLDGASKDYKSVEIAVIPLDAKHQIENLFKEPLVFIEVQYGS
jgi:mannose-6-phosphate isomerase-like protein (cupin superfamily)